MCAVIFALVQLVLTVIYAVLILTFPGTAQAVGPIYLGVIVALWLGGWEFKHGRWGREP